MFINTFLKHIFFNAILISFHFLSKEFVYHRMCSQKHHTLCRKCMKKMVTRKKKLKVRNTMMKVHDEIN